MAAFSFISRNWAAGCSNLISRTAAAIGCSSWISQRAVNVGCSSWISQGSVTPATPPSSSKILSIFLMLPPDFENDRSNIVYNFYSLAEKKLLSFNKKKRGDGEEDDDSLPEDDAELVGSSHGWLALFNKRNSNLFLYNPLSCRHIKLPSVDTLPFPEINVSPRNGVEKLILSCSPEDEENCRAMINYGPSDRLAFCWPGHTEWIPISNLGNYVDFVYSSEKKLFFCALRCPVTAFEAWDLLDPQSPRLIRIVITVDRMTHPFSNRTLEVLCANTVGNSWWPNKFLIVAEHSGELFLVKRYTLSSVGPDGSSVQNVFLGPSKGFNMSLPYKTISFDVYKFEFDDSEERAFLKYMDNGSLEGLAFFIGSNHGFALCASEFPNELIKPNSIYFTDVDSSPSPIFYPDEDYHLTYGGHDIGIFNYENLSLSPCYYPCDVQGIQRIEPSPMWFTPSQQPYESSI